MSWKYIFVLILVFGIVFTGCSEKEFLKTTPTPEATPTSTPTPTPTIQKTPTLTPTSTPVNIEKIKDSMVLVSCYIKAYDFNGYKIPLKTSGSGVVIWSEPGKIYVVTSRHVIDCVYTGDCWGIIWEKITLTSLKGTRYPHPFKILYAPGNVDLAILEILPIDENLIQIDVDVKPAEFTDDYEVGDKVIAAGFPAYNAESPTILSRFKLSEGHITDIGSLITHEGVSFKIIESDAITGHGASGGGVFTPEGYLIGFITWGNSKETIAIGADTIYNTDYLWYFCNCQDCYRTPSGYCCRYGTVEYEGECLPLY